MMATSTRAASISPSTKLARASAVGAFSSTFSGVDVQSASSAARSRKISGNLPVEILIIIFSLVYNDVYHLRWLERDAVSPTLFPYAIASVCSLWRDAMSLVPKFWRRVVFLVDSPATPTSAILSQLSWSGDVQLDVIITRRTFHDDVDRDYERAHIVSIMNIISSHIHRIRDLRFDVIFSSSLPSFPTDFHGTAANLYRLDLGCRKDDGGSNQCASLSAAEHEEFNCQNLMALVLDGRNYYEACRRDATWTKMIAGVEYITISHFKPRPGESFSSYEFLRPLTAIGMDVLRVRDVVLDPAPEELQTLDFPNTDILDFEDMHDYQIIDQIIYLMLDPFEITLIRCTLGRIADTSRHFGDPIRGGRLILKEIDHDMTPLLRLCDNLELHFTSCPSFDDTILDAMGTEDNGIFVCATYVQTLVIIDCRNFTIAALRRFVESRLRLPPSNDGWDSDTIATRIATRIYNITLAGDVPSISHADRAWFEANVPSFQNINDQDILFGC